MKGSGGIAFDRESLLRFAAIPRSLARIDVRLWKVIALRLTRDVFFKELECVCIQKWKLLASRVLNDVSRNKFLRKRAAEMVEELGFRLQT